MYKMKPSNLQAKDVNDYYVRSFDQMSLDVHKHDIYLTSMIFIWNN